VSNREVKPPQGGVEAPRVSSPLADGRVLDLVELATEICDRYRLEFPDEQERYGAAGIAWCIHDNQHLLNWATEAVNGDLEMNDEVAWLANVLEARDFPADRLARNLDIGADVVAQMVVGPPSRQLAAVLTDSADFVRSGDFRDYPG
jgi:hypothetical protein